MLATLTFPRWLATASPSTALLALLLVVPWLWPWAPGPSAQVVPLLASWSCMALAGLLWLVSPAVRDAGPRLVACTWLAAACLSSLMGLLQWFGWADGLPGVHPSRLGEAFANLRQRNLFASLTSIGLLAALCLHARSARPHSRAWASAAVVLGLGCAASLSRTGALQWLLIVGVALARPGSRRLAMTAGVAYVAGVLLLPVALQALHGIDAPGLMRRLTDAPHCGSRLVLWSNVLHLVSLKPWSGWGAGELDYAHYATLYAGPRFCDILDNAHNLPLHLAVEFGIPVALLACLGLAVWLLRRKPWRARDPWQVLAWGVLGVIALHSLLEYPLWYGPFQLAAALALVLLGALRVSEPPRTGTRLAGLAVGGAALVMLAWAFGCYDRVSQAYLEPRDRRAAFRDEPLRDVRPGPFGGHADFAALALTPLSRASAPQLHALALRLLHFSPEPRVIDVVIDSAVVLGKDDVALWHLARLRAAFPEAHAERARGLGLTQSP